VYDVKWDSIQKRDSNFNRHQSDFKFSAKTHRSFLNATMGSSTPPRSACVHSKLFHCTTSILLLLPASSSFILRPPSFLLQRTILSAKSHIVDVDFVRVNPDAESNREIDGDAVVDDNSKSLFELSLETDPDFLETRIPFIDHSSKSSSGTNYIDVKLAFMAELDGVQYGIAIPFDSAAALTLEKEDGTVQYLSPDLDENEELMAIMAGQLQENVGDDLRLQRTPRVLTISGPLDNYTINWQGKLLPDPIKAQELMAEVDEGGDELAFFHKFMKDELGEEEYEKTLNEIPDEDEMNELLKLFEVPGLGDRSDDVEGLEELFKSLLTPEKDFDEAKEALGANSLDHEGVALKLVSYVFAGGKTYSLVKLLKPYALIGKYIPDDKDARFELLTQVEEKLILPRLEEVCKQDLEAAGLSLAK
jgi:hypothetical protein